MPPKNIQQKRKSFEAFEESVKAMSISPTNRIQMGASVMAASIIKSSEKPSSSSKKDKQPANKHDDQKTNSEADLNAISAIKCIIKSEPQDLTRLRNAIRRRESVDAIVTKHIFDKLKRSRVSCEQIVDILVETECPLDFALLMENAEVFRGLLERKENLPRDEYCRLVEFAMQLPYLQCLKMLLHYGPDVKVSRDAFTERMFDMINRPCANLKSAKLRVEKLMECNVIDQFTMKFLEKTFERGYIEPIEMLLSTKIDEYMSEKFGEDPLVHLFANVNVDVVKLLRGRRFNVNAKCGGMSALHFATYTQIERNVRILLNSGADSNARDCNGMTPLFAFGNEKCVMLLLINGADVQMIADYNGYTLLDMKLEGPVLGILLAHLALIEYRGVRIEKEIRDKIVSNLSFIEFYDKICTQIENSREIRIHDGFTLWNALILRPETIAEFVDSLEVIDKLVLECRKLEIHLYYQDVLERNFEIAFGVYGLRFRAIEEISLIFEEVGLVDVIIERIVEFMSFEDLIVFA